MCVVCCDTGCAVCCDDRVALNTARQLHTPHQIIHFPELWSQSGRTLNTPGWLAVVVPLNKSVSVGAVWLCGERREESEALPPSHTRGPGRVALASGPALALSPASCQSLTGTLSLTKGKVTTQHRPARPFLIRYRVAHPRLTPSPHTLASLTSHYLMKISKYFPLYLINNN